MVIAVAIWEVYVIRQSDYKDGSGEAYCVCNSKQWENTSGGISTIWSYSHFTLFIVSFSEVFCFF